MYDIFEILLWTLLFAGMPLVYVLYYMHIDDKTDKQLLYEEICSKNCFARAGEYPDSIWSDKSLIKQLNDNLRKRQTAKFVCGYYMCIGQQDKKKKRFIPSDFMKYLLKNGIEFKKLSTPKTIDEITHKIDHTNELHYRIGNKSVLFHDHKDNGRRYFYTKSPWYRFLFKKKFDRLWDGKKEPTETVTLAKIAGNYSTWLKKKNLVVEIGHQQYRFATGKEIQAFINFVKRN